MPKDLISIENLHKMKQKKSNKALNKKFNLFEMNRIKAILLILQLSLCQTLSFDSKDVCLKETVYVNKYDEHFRFMEKEAKENCINEANPFDCGPEYCAASQEACEKFIQEKLISKILKLNKFLSEQTYSIANQIQEIKSCAKSTNAYNSSEICINKQSCLKRSWKWKIRILVPIKCKCLSEFSYHCGKSHCTTNKDACKFFQSQNNQQSAQLKVCANFVII